MAVWRLGAVDIPAMVAAWREVRPCGVGVVLGRLHLGRLLARTGAVSVQLHLGENR